MLQNTLLFLSNGSEWWPEIFFCRNIMMSHWSWPLTKMPSLHHFICHILIFWEVTVTFDLQSQFSSYSSERLGQIWRQSLEVLLRYCVRGMGCMYIRSHTKCRHSGCPSIWTDDLKTSCLLCSTQISSIRMTHYCCLLSCNELRILKSSWLQELVLEVLEKKKAPAHQLFVPCLVGGCPSPDVVDHVGYKEEDEEKGTSNCPHYLPVPVGTMTKHIFYVFFKPKISRKCIKIRFC